MVRKELFDKIGGFDKDIFMYAEESLLCRQTLKNMNYRICNVPSAHIIHFDGGSIGTLSEFKANAICDGNYLYYFKSFGSDEAIRYLKTFLRIYSRRMRLSSLFSKKRMTYYRILKNAYYSKLITISKSNYGF